MKTKWKVDIIESEAGWGQKVDSTEIFQSFDEAMKYVEEFNSQNNLPHVPDWYMYASSPYQSEDELDQ